MSIVTLPLVFDPAYYRAMYPALSRMDDQQLVAHFRKFGIVDGLIGSSGALRKTQVDTAQSERSVLEIGPLNSPAILGPTVKYMDAYDSEGLSKSAAAYGLDPSTVPSIDYVSPTGSFDMVDRKFDAVFTSHSIEHVPDLVRHLNNISTVLKEDGRYYVICPDKRFCFDHFRAESTIADVLHSYVEQPLRHSMRTHLSHRLLTTRNNNPFRHWAGDHGEPRYLEGASLKTVLAGLPRGDDYADSHAWQFTPRSFFSIIQSLQSEGLIDMGPERVHHTPRDAFEFTAVLKKGGQADYPGAFLPAIEADFKAQPQAPTSQLQEITSQHARLKIELEAALAEGLALEEQLTKIKKSFSWRATKPLRSLTKRISIR
jgi:SAM-dependent methyltransferase